MNLQQVIDHLTEKSDEFKANEKLATSKGDEKGAYAFNWVAGELLERAEYFKEVMEKEQSGNAAQEAELKHALKREGPADESTSD